MPTKTDDDYLRVDLAELSDEAAAHMAGQLVSQLAEARAAVDQAERRVAGIRKWLDGLVEMFPQIDDLLPEDLDDDEEPHPRGAEAVRIVLEDNQGEWFTVPSVVGLLSKRDWLPKSSKPSNAVRTALERLCERGRIDKARSTDGAVIYRYPEPEPERGDEEPF